MWGQCLKNLKWYGLLEILLSPFLNALTHIKLNIDGISSTIQKQPSIGVLTKKSSENMQLIYRIKPMLKCDLNKVTKNTLFNRTLLVAASVPGHSLHLVYLCSMQGLALFLLYLCDLFFIFIFIFIIISSH